MLLFIFHRLCKKENAPFSLVGRNSKDNELSMKHSTSERAVVNRRTDRYDDLQQQHG